MKFSIIKEDKKKIRLKQYIYGSILIIFLEGFFFYPKDEDNLKIILFFVLPIIIWFVAIIYANLSIKNFKVIGYVMIVNNHLEFLKETINLDNIALAKITYQSYMWKHMPRMTLAQGDNNEIFILTKEKKQYRLNILLKDKHSLKSLKRFAASLIEKNVKVQFYMGHKKIYPKKKT